MTLNINSTKALNSTQTPIDVSDQPVYAITKELQYHYPHLFEKYCPIMGGLHIEQSLLAIHGQLIEGSGLTEIIALYNFSTIGLSAIIDASHIKRAGYGIQVTVCSLFIKLQKATLKDASNLHPCTWLVEKSKSNKMCFIWKISLDLEMHILTFVRFQREGNFQLYREIICTIIRWYFPLDHFHYARWLSVHLFDSMTLDIVHKDVFENFLLGHFCFKKTNKVFSKIALDQLHEQNNRIIKSSELMIQLLFDGNHVVLSCIINESEETFRPQVKSSNNHHEDCISFSFKFYSDIKTLYEAIPVNPFVVEDDMIFRINDPSAVLLNKTFVTMPVIIEDGEKQFRSFIQDRLLYQKVSICSPIHKNNFNLWQSRQTQLEKHRALSSLTIRKYVLLLNTDKI